MARTNALQTVTYNGKSLDEHHKNIREALLDADPIISIDDAMTLCGIDDPYARGTIKRSFMLTLRPADGSRPAGDNFDLTVERKWLANRDTKWTKDLKVPKGKNQLTFYRTTVPTTELSQKIAVLNGALSNDVRDAATNITKVLTQRANVRLDEASIAYISEDVGIIIAENAILNREIKIREESNENLKKALGMMEDMLAKIPNQNQSGSIRRT